MTFYTNQGIILKDPRHKFIIKLGIVYLELNCPFIFHKFGNKRAKNIFKPVEFYFRLTDDQIQTVILHDDIFYVIKPMGFNFFGEKVEMLFIDEYSYILGALIIKRVLTTLCPGFILLNKDTTLAIVD